YYRRCKLLNTIYSGKGIVIRFLSQSFFAQSETSFKLFTLLLFLFPSIMTMFLRKIATSLLDRMESNK
ncbi:hypothetical protein HMPREF1365_02005, partial [Enterococcus faecium ERV168]